MSNFYQLFLECAERWPNNIAAEIQRGDRLEGYSYAELRRKAESVAKWLQQSRFQPGDRIAILADNHPFWVAAYLGIIAAGCTAVPLDTALHSNQLATLLKDSGTALLFCASKYLSVAQQAVKELPIKLVLTDRSANPTAIDQGPKVLSTLDDIFSAGPQGFSLPAIAPEALASLLYTSGTTADPKGVMLTHANLMGEVDAVFSRVEIGPQDALLGVLPLFHVLSQMANLLLPLVKGSRIVYLETLNTTELLRALAEREITVFAVVPQFFYLIHERIFKEVAKRGRAARTLLPALMAITRFSRRFGWNPGKNFFRTIHDLFGPRMRYLVTGGSRFDPQIARDFSALGIDILQAYGLTETTGGAFVNPPGDIVFGSVGPPLGRVEGRIVDPQPQEDGGERVGEIAIRGAIVMKGYWNRPDATAAVLNDGWLLTGDLGYFDSHGNLFITGRKKEVIVLSNGKNVYPEEIEAHYLQSAYIKEICVMGLEDPGRPQDDKLHAIIVPNFEVLRQKKIVNAKEVIRYDVEGYSSKLPSTKRIGSYEIWQEDLPRTTTRKLKRFEIEKRVHANQGSRAAEPGLDGVRSVSEEDQQWLDQPNIQRALRIVKEAAKEGRETILPSDNLELDLGLDSMQRVELLVALERELNGDLEESRLAEIYTVKELVGAVLESVSSGSGKARSELAAWKTILAEEPTDPQVLALTKPYALIEHLAFGVARLAQIVALDRLQMKIAGLEKVPRDGPFILSSNHQSYIDPLVMSSVLPWPVFSNLFSVGTSDIFGGGVMRLLARLLRVVVVDPDANLLPAMRAGAYGLRHGRVLILYPEGERSIDGPPKIFKKGAAILSIHLQAPIVPVAIDGFEKVWPRGKPFQGFFPVKMQFGDPIMPPPESTASEKAYEDLTTQLKARVVAMWEKIRDTE